MPAGGLVLHFERKPPIFGSERSKLDHLTVPFFPRQVEYAIPEQFKTTITPSGLATIVADSTG
jgi:hypothetical protein